MSDDDHDLNFRDLRKMQKITIPGELGMSGLASSTGEIIYSNNTDAEKKFQNDVDN